MRWYQMKQKWDYVVETYDKLTNTIAHTMEVKSGEYIQSDYDTQLAIIDSAPARYSRTIVPLYLDCAKSYSAAGGKK